MTSKYLFPSPISIKKDINKKLAKALFKCKFLNMMRRNTFLQKHVSMKLLEVSLSYLRFILSVPDEGHSRNVPCPLNNISVFITLSIWLGSEENKSLAL
jgi:hypothetical protein